MNQRMDITQKEQLIQLNTMVINGETLSSEQTSLHEFLKQKDLESSRVTSLEDEADLCM